MNVQPAPIAQAVPVAAAVAAAVPNQPLAQWGVEVNALNLQGEHRLLHELLRSS